MTNIESNLNGIHKTIIDAERRFARPVSAVKLLAVSKQQPISKIRQAIAAGQIEFAENYLQDALKKIETLQDIDLIWHFIGHIQSNKTAEIAKHFDWIHSIDKEKIAQRLSNQRPKHLPSLMACIQVNVSQEESKSGISIEEVPALADKIAQLPNITLRGLMAIPAPLESFEQQRNIFKQVRHAFTNLKEKGFDLDTLSMGMSNDYIAAIGEGATIVRLGTALFGERETSHSTD